MGTDTKVSSPGIESRVVSQKKVPRDLNLNTKVNLPKVGPSGW